LTQPKVTSHESAVQNRPSSQFSTRQNAEHPEQLSGGIIP
jgi:hypothetical protein